MARTQPSPRFPPEIEAGVKPTRHSSAQKRVAPWAACVIVSIGVSVYVWCTFRVYEAHRLSAYRDDAALRRAIALQPKDAELHDLLGQSLMWKTQEFQYAAFEFEQATKLDPSASAYWLHLAQVYATLGDQDRQDNAVRKALRADPTTPDIAWNAANLALLQGHTDEALDELSVVIRNDPAMADAALDLSWRSSGDLAAVERRLPSTRANYLRFLKVLVNHQQWAAARAVWSSLLQMPDGSDDTAALFYIDALLDKRDVAGARSAWEDLVRRSPTLRSYHHSDNLVVDGSFEHDILNAAFDWRYREQPNTALQVDTSQSHHGTQALLVTYSGPNPDTGLFQYVPVTPGVTYTASAWAKSEELDSANGPRLSISDPYTNVEYAHSEDTIGTTTWHPLHTSFTAPPNAVLVVIQFSRAPADTQIRGKFWIDNVRISKNDSNIAQ